MADAIIYAAGNPDLYPIEYYDSNSGAYEGIIPQMLADFADESGYDFSYYRAEQGDLREELGRNRNAVHDRNTVQSAWRNGTWH